MLTQQPANARLSLLAALVAALAGCASRLPEPASRSPESASVAGDPALTKAPDGARRCPLDDRQSQVMLLVYRSGPLARLGHNHVITSAVETGYVWLGRRAGESGFEIRVPVHELAVDEPQARLLAGEQFMGEVPDAARSGTASNMLRPEVLDGERYPEVLLSAAGLTGDEGEMPVPTTVSIRGIARRIDVPTSVRITAHEVRASGRLQIRQTEFGITPFSVAGGAIQVADEVDVSFEFVATCP